MNLFVSGFPLDLETDELHEIFSEYGKVKSAKIILDRETNLSRGFGFVEFYDAADAGTAIKTLNGGSIDGKTLTVKTAQVKERINKS